MQPKILSPIFAPTNSIPGVGPRTAELFKKLPAECIIDLAWHFPNGFVDRRNAPKIKNAKIGTIATILVTIEQHEKPYHPRQPHRVLCSDETGEIYIVFFRSKIEWLTKALPLGKKRFISGLVESYSKGGLQIIHPDYIVKEEESSLILINEPKYSLTIGLTPKTIRRSITAAISRLPDLDEWQDEKWRNQNDWPTWKDAIIKAHAPETESDLDPNAPWRRRLSYDELLANQLAINLVRAHSHLNSGFSTKTSQRLRKLIQPYIKF